MVVLLVIGIGLLLAQALAWRRNGRETRRGLRQFHRPGGAEDLIPILMPVCGRPHYLHRVLEALARVSGIERTVLVVSQDGRNPEVAGLIAGIGFAEVIVLEHTRPFGGILAYFWDSLHAASVNIRFLLDFAFTGLGVEYAIVLEDDLLPAPDFLAYFTWACRHVLADRRVLSVTGFNLQSRLSPSQGFDPRDYPGDLVENREDGRPKFTGWSWAIAAAQWQRIRKHWSVLSWDIALDATQRRLGLVSYKPVLGRVKNIGMQAGINFTETEENPKWTGMVMAEEDAAPAIPPRLLAADPVIPPYRDLPPSCPLPNERQRTRFRRLALGVALAALVAGELLFLGW